jgi:hypothetical protein
MLAITNLGPCARYPDAVVLHKDRCYSSSESYEALCVAAVWSGTEGTTIKPAREDGKTNHGS